MEIKKLIIKYFISILFLKVPCIFYFFLQIAYNIFYKSK